MSEIYSGKIKGIVSSKSIEFGNFVLKLEENIQGIPGEIQVFNKLHRLLIFREGDEVTIDGKILKKYLKYWDKYMYMIRPAHIWNDTLKVGF